MAPLFPVYQQFRTFDHIFLFEAKSDQRLVLKVYDLSKKCIFKKSFLPTEHAIANVYTLLSKQPSDSLYPLSQEDVIVAEKKDEQEEKSLPSALSRKPLKRSLGSQLLDYLIQKNLLSESEIPKSPIMGQINISGCVQDVKDLCTKINKTIPYESSNLEENYSDCITKLVFENPVVDDHGHTFEKSTLEAWMQQSHNLCPINRERINNKLTPNLLIKAIIDEAKNKPRIPTFEVFNKNNKNNKNIADCYFATAVACAKEKEYDEAVNSVAKALQYTNSWEDYAKLPMLFKEMQVPDKEFLSSLYLTQYQLQAGKVLEAIQTLKECKTLNPDLREINLLLIKLYIVSQQIQEAAILFNYSHVYPASNSETIEWCKCLLICDPFDWNLYQLLSNLLENPQQKAHVLLQGTCHALEIQQYGLAQQFYQAAERLDMDFFVDRLLLFELLKAKGQDAQIKNELLRLSQIYDKKNLPLQSVKIYKWLASLEYNPKYYIQIILAYKKLQEKPKADKWSQILYATSIAEANSGNADGMRAFGLRYNLGLGVEKNDALALQWFQKAADLGDPKSMYNLGIMYEYGEGVGKDYALALQWFQKAADLGDRDAMRHMGIMYENGKGVGKDYALALQWYQKAADLGDRDAIRYMGIMYENGKGVGKDYALALQWYQKAADLGDRDAMRYMGIMYENGKGVGKDYALALQWFQKAADLGDRDAMRYIGIMYEDGKGVEKNDALALQWYQKAADLGDRDAMRNIGEIYKISKEVKNNDALALQWFQKAADLGDPAAMCNLGIMYANGKGVANDYALAFQCFQKAADLGNRDAMRCLGLLYNTGQWADKNDVLSAQWYQKAAELDDMYAMVSLAEMYERGIGVAKDYFLALQLLQTAANLGNSDAMFELSRVYAHGRLGVEKNEDLANQWYQKAQAAKPFDTMNHIM